MEKYHQKKKFTKNEDTQLIKLVKKYGMTNWEEISRHMQRRTARQCRDRYKNYLIDDFKKGSWTENEDRQIVSLYHKIGPHWLTISKSMPGRSGNDIKNRWHKTLVKKIRDYDDIFNNNDSTTQSDTDNKNTTDTEKEIDITKKTIITNQDKKTAQLINNNVNNVFDFYETEANQWNLFPDEEEKKQRFDI